jgi:hypothetical protein
VLNKKSASLGLVVSAAAGILLTGSPVNAQADLAGSWHHHHRHSFFHRHGHVSLNHNRPRIFIRIFIYNRNNNVAIARNDQAQAQRERQLQRQRQWERERQRQGDPGRFTRRPDLTPTTSAPMAAPDGTAAQQAHPQGTGGSGVTRDPGVARDSGTPPQRQSASAEEGAGSSEWQTP